MAATLFPSRPETSPPNVHTIYPRNLISDLDFGDNRYPSLTPNRRTSGIVNSDGAVATKAGKNKEPASPEVRSAELPATDQDSQKAGPSDLQSLKSQSQELARSQVSYVLPQGPSARRVVERYSLEDNQPSTSRAPVEPAPMNVPVRPLDSIAVPYSSSPRHPAIPVSTTAIPPAIVPLSASPGYIPPVSTRNRAYPQQPTYITQNATPTAVNPVYSPRPPQEEICVECAMRDQDMADVDVTTPGIWARDSDIHYEELKAREAEEEATGVLDTDESPRPKSKGGRLTEQNIKIWLSINPREPASRQNTLTNYVTAQRKLVEAEVLAHARAMQEAKQLDNRMRDTYSALRRSAYDSGATAAPTDDTGGVRIRPPRSPSSPTHDRSHSREITLLENGMIVEHVDVRREERETRERRRKEERRARKSSRSSVVDMTSLMSTPSLPTHTDSGVGLRPYSRYSQSSPARPTSVLTAEFPRAQSQASFSDLHSLGSSSPRRSRFFGFSNFKDGWMSRDSLAPSAMMSGSMMDMHVALQKEENQASRYSATGDLGRQVWNEADLEPTTSRQSMQSDGKRKKKKGLAKIWNMVTRSSKHDDKKQTDSARMDDEPLAPPPPLTYLLSREGRHASTPSLSSPSMRMSTSPISLMSATASTSHLPTPSTSRPTDSDSNFTRRPNGNPDDSEGRNEDRLSKNLHAMTSEPDMRKRVSQSPPSSPGSTPTPPTHHSNNTTLAVPHSRLTREKSLPPLPHEVSNQRSAERGVLAARPQTVYTFEPRHSPPGAGPPHDFVPPQAPFRTADARRQSFGGLASRPTFESLMGRKSAGPTGTAPNVLPPTYDEFGGSRRSLRLDQASNRKNAQPAKRKSKFGLSSLFGKKEPERNLMQENVAQQFPTYRRSAGSDGLEESGTNGWYGSTSRHSVFSGNGLTPSVGTRMSVTSRKALEELVAQDTDFVAYRYPSNDQHIALLR